MAIGGFKEGGRAAARRQQRLGKEAPRTGRPSAPRDPSKKKFKPVFIISDPTEKKKSRNVFGASDEKIHKKPHATREGSWASIKRAGKRFRDKTYKIEDYGDKSLDIQWKAEQEARRAKKAKGGRADFRRGGKGTGPSAGTRIKARKARDHEWWTGHTGTQGIYSPTIDKKLREKRPHSSPEGRMRDVKKIMADAKIAGKKRKWPGPKIPKREFTPLKKPSRAKHGIGSLVKKIVTKIKPKPKPKPGKVDQRFLDFIKTGKLVDKHGVKVNVPKVAERLTGKPHVDHGIRNKESKKVFKSAKGKAAGGRIGLKHGLSPQQHYLEHGYGPTKAKLRSGKPKIAKKGWA